MKKRITVLFVIAIAISSLASGQKENYNWLFATSQYLNPITKEYKSFGFDFNLYNNYPNLFSFQSGDTWNWLDESSSISDSSGKLLFHNYCDDWTECIGFGLDSNLGWPYCDEIIKHHFYGSLFFRNQYENNNYYYLYVTDSSYSTDPKHTYHLLALYLGKLSKDPQKKYGDIISNEKCKWSTAKYGSTWGITGCYHQNKKDIWIVTHGPDSNTYYSFLFGKNGMTKEPVVSRTDDNLKYWGWNFWSNSGGNGYAKLSPDGKKFYSVVGDWYFWYWYKQSCYIKIFDFDNSTGKISSTPVYLEKRPNAMFMHSSEFSSDGSKIYLSETYFINDSATGPLLCKLYQIDLSDNYKKVLLDSGKIDNPDYESFNNLTDSVLYSSMELAPDKRIYIANNNQDYVSAILDPNKPGTACKFVKRAMELGTKCSMIMPTFLHDYFIALTVKVSSNSPVCSGQAIRLTSDLIFNAEYEWSGPNGFTSDRSNPIIPNADPSMSGYYRLTLTSNSQVATDSVYVVVNPKPDVDIAFKSDSIICDSNPVVLQAISSDTTKCTFTWSTGETTDEIIITKGGKYSVIITNEFGCRDTASRTIIQSDKPKVTLSALGATSFCEGDSVVLQAKAGIGYSYQWGGDYYSENFEIRKSFPEWSTKITDPEWQNPIKPDSNEFPYRRYLGLFGNQLIKLTLGNLPKHDSVDVSFDIYIVATWDGNVNTENGPDLFRVLDLSCNTLYSSTTSFSRMEGARQSYPERYPAGDNPKDSGAIDKLMINNEQVSFSATVYRLNYRFAHDCSNLQLGLNALLQDISSNFQNESWAIDNVKLKLSTVLPDTNVIYRWTAGETVQTITVGKTGNYQVEVINQAGCSDTASIYIKVNPNPIPTISGKTKLCPGEKTTLTVADEYKSYQWSTGDFTKSITVEAPIIYIVIVTDSNGCTGTAEVLVEKNIKPSVSIIGDTVFCSGTTVKLSADGDFAEYQWDRGDTTKEINVTQGGTYKLTVTDANGCQNSDELVLTENKIKISGLDDLDFSSVASGKDSVIFVTIKNESNTYFDITRIYAKNAPADFIVSVTPDLPWRHFEPNNIIPFKIQFKPIYYKDYSDSLIFESDSPCPFTAGAAMKGRTETNTFVWLPDTTAKIGDPDFCIPLMARRQANISISEPMSFTAEIRFNVTAMQPNNLNSTIIAGERVLNISADNIRLDSIDTQIFEFCSKIFLPDKDLVPLILTDFKWSKTNISANRQDGSLRIKGLCQPSISRITLLNKQSFQIMENPVIDELTIHLSQSWELSESVKVEIFSTLGLKMYSVGAGSKPAQELRIDVASLPPGMYFVRIGEIVGKFVKL